MQKSTVKDIVLAITYRCNSHCRMCNIWQIKDHENEFSLLDLANLPDGLESLNLSGGEPFLRKDLEEIVREVKKRLPKTDIIISTNGFATELVLEKTRKILKINPDIGIAVSLDGIGVAHDKIRGIPDGYQKVLETIKGLKELGLKKLRLAFTVGDYNFSELPGVYELARTLDIEMTLAAVHSSQNFFNKENKTEKEKEIIKRLEWLIEEELKSWSPKRWLRAYFTYGLKIFLKTGKRILPDYSGELNAFIDPKGNIYPCDISTQKIGNLKKNFDLKEVDRKECEASWMICTVRQAIKKHWLKVLSWILISKFFKLS